MSSTLEERAAEVTDYDERRVVSRLANVNSRIAKFIVREIDVDAGRAQHMTPEQELELAHRVEQAGRDLRARATRRIEARER